jgi:GT2 family glycosyltransferase
LNGPIRAIESLDGYDRLQALVRLHGTPIGYVNVPVTNGCCTGRTIGKAIFEQHAKAIVHHLLCDSLAVGGGLPEWSIEDLLEVPHPVYSGALPKVTVAVCSRDRTVDLARCLDSLKHLDYPDLDLLVVDNSPSNGATERLLRNTYPNIRYVREPRPGLNWARNRAILEAKGEIIAYTDDDVVVDPGLIRALAIVFAEDPDVMAVTGLVVPFELETEAQILFEKFGGFGRGFEPKWYRMGRGAEKGAAILHGGAGKFGTGANMAYRRTLFDRIGFFDPALDVGTPTGGGGDLEMFFRVIKEGYTLVYEPDALVRHVHRRDHAGLRSQLMGWGTGFYAYLVRNALVYPHEAIGFLRLGLWWLWSRNIRRFLVSLLNSPPKKRSLVIAELLGSLVGVVRYFQARSIAAKIEDKFGALAHSRSLLSQLPADPVANGKDGVAVRSIDLMQPLKPLTDVAGYSSTRIFVTRGRHSIGFVDIDNYGDPISAARLRDAIAKVFNFKLLEGYPQVSLNLIWADAMGSLKRQFVPEETEAVKSKNTQLPADISVSVVVATYDRPDQLRNCLHSLIEQETKRKVEIIIVDNNPSSGMTPPVVAEFPGVTLIRERRKGLSYARNAGILASTGDVVITTDDDVEMPSDWLEKLIAPFARDDVMTVTGNVLPLKLETNAERLFEAYGGLSRGFEPREVDADWFESFGRRAVPTWSIGSTANAAFRADIFGDQQIGLFDEALGAGTPTGCSEDTYLFYKVLKAGFMIIYEPSAYVWHNHRPDMKGLRRQIYNYSKGHVAYHLTTLIKDHDLRGALRIAVELPRWHIWRIKEWSLGRRFYPLSLTIREIFGNTVGPWALWQSRRRVKKLGRSQPYTPVSQRSGLPEVNTASQETCNEFWFAGNSSGLKDRRNRFCRTD